MRGWEYVQPAIQDAIEVAQTASRVLKENYNDPEVQKLIKMVFGGRDTDAKAREAQSKSKAENIAQNQLTRAIRVFGWRRSIQK